MAPKPPQIELKPDAWQRFERAVDVVAKSPPQHKVSKEQGSKRPAKKTRKERS
jgi:hypothetical protein